jgi:hypothetical protein
MRIRRRRRSTRARGDARLMMMRRRREKAAGDRRREANSCERAAKRATGAAARPEPDRLGDFFFSCWSFACSRFSSLLFLWPPLLVNSRFRLSLSVWLRTLCPPLLAAA